MRNKQMEIMAREHDLTAIDTEFAQEVVQATAEGAVSGYQKIEHGVITGYKKIEDGVVGGYKKMEQSIVYGFNKVTDACVKTLFAKDGETVEEAKARLTKNAK